MYPTFGTPLYLPADGKLIFPIVEKKIKMKKDQGINPIYVKARWMERDVSEELRQIDPNHPLLKKGLVYRQQLTTKCLRLCGFKKNVQNTCRPTLELEW